MVRETRVQSQVESYQRLKKWYLVPPCLTLSVIRYRSRVKQSNKGNGVAPSPTPLCSSYWKARLWSPSIKVANFAYLNAQRRSYMGSWSVLLTNAHLEAVNYQYLWWVSLYNVVILNIKRGSYMRLDLIYRTIGIIRFDLPYYWHNKLSVRECLGDRGSIPSPVILKTQKMVLDATLFNTQRYKVRIKGKVEQSR